MKTEITHIRRTGDNDMNIKHFITATIVALTLPMQAMAAADIRLNITAEKEVAVTEGDRVIKKRVAAQTIEPGEEIVYTIRYTNRGDLEATNVDVKNPVPSNTVYVGGSATGKGADITFSADGGKNFGKASSVTYQVTEANGKQSTRKASPENYTNIRWIIKRVDPGQSGELGYRVRVK
jgi:uncharacterized repeat protein (TIGR01451 family)